MKKSHFLFSRVLLSFFGIVAFAFSGGSSFAYSYGQDCPSYYSPLCAEKGGVKSVFQNICTMNASGATFVQWGACSTGYSSSHPVVSNPVYIPYQGVSYISSQYLEYPYSQYNTDYSNSYPSFYDSTHPIQKCSQENKPVCGEISGVKRSYSNSCFAIKNGASIVSYSACQQKVRQKITCVFSGSNTNQNCKVVNGNSYEQCSGKTSCSFYTASRAKNSYIEVKNTCSDYRNVKIDGYDESMVSSCYSRYVAPVCPVVTGVSCGYGYKKVSNGIYSNGCSRGYSCVRNYVQNYSNYYGGQNYYSSSTYSSFEISRNNNQYMEKTLRKGESFTMNVVASYSDKADITVTIPSGVEVMNVLKGNCQKTFVYGGTRLRCLRTDGIQFQARANKTISKKEFVAIFSQYGYNTVYKKLLITIQ